MDTVDYANIRAAMATYGLKTTDLAKIIGRSYRQTYAKLNKYKSKKGKMLIFDTLEAAKLTAYFREKGYEKIIKQNVTMDYFFDEVVTNETRSA